MKATPILFAGGCSAFISLLLWTSVCDSSLAQTYSANLVGYVDAELLPGSNLVANPLNAGDNTMRHLLPNLPDGSYFVVWNPELQRVTATNWFIQAEGWTMPDLELNHIQGGFLWLPQSHSVSWVGEVWPSKCADFVPSRVYYTSVLPQQLCPSAELLPTVPDGSTIIPWDADTQQFGSTLTYIAVARGWFDSGFSLVEPSLAPGLAAVIIYPSGYGTVSVRSPGTSVRVVPTDLVNVSKDGLAFTFQFLAGQGLEYVVLRKARLGTTGWQVVASDTSPGGMVTVVDSVAEAAFYQVDCLRLFHPVRGPNSFSFQFYARERISYAVRRSGSLSDGPGEGVMTLIGPENGGILTVTDTAATNRIACYSLMAAP